MRTTQRLISTASAAVLLASLAACGSQPIDSGAPVSSYPSTSAYPTTQYPAGSVAPVGYAEYGRVTSVEVVRTQEAGQGTGAGAIIGGIAGGVVGNQVGGGSGRDIARIAGIAGGALAGNAIEKNSRTQIRDSYRVSVRTDNGAMRAYDLATSGDLRTGDRVRIENGQVYRY